MAIKVAINGFGRIGRSVLRAALEADHPELEFVAINDLGDPDTNCHLLNFDSVHGRLRPEARLEDGVLLAGRHHIQMMSERDPTALDWSEIDLVMECTGIFTSKETAMNGIKI